MIVPRCTHLRGGGVADDADVVVLLEFQFRRICREAWNGDKREDGENPFQQSVHGERQRPSKRRKIKRFGNGCRCRLPSVWNTVIA